MKRARNVLIVMLFVSLLIAGLLYSLEVLTAKESLYLGGGIFLAVCVAAARSLFSYSILGILMKENNRDPELESIQASDSSNSQKKIVNYLCEELSIAQKDVEKSIIDDLRVNYSELENTVRNMQLDNKLPIHEGDITKESSVASIANIITDRLNSAK